VDVLSSWNLVFATRTCGQAVPIRGRMMQETVAGLLREHLSHQLASGKQPPQLSEAPIAAEVHGICGTSSPGLAQV
jgi:hypothetical protein